MVLNKIAGKITITISRPEKNVTVGRLIGITEQKAVTTDISIHLRTGGNGLMIKENYMLRGKIII